MKKASTNFSNLRSKKFSMIAPLSITRLSNSLSRSANSSKVTVRLPTVENDDSPSSKTTFLRNFNTKYESRSDFSIKQPSCVLLSNLKLDVNAKESKRVLKNPEKKPLKLHKNKSIPPPNKEFSGTISVVMMPLPYSTYKIIESQRTLNRLHRLLKNSRKSNQENICSNVP